MLDTTRELCRNCYNDFVLDTDLREAAKCGVQVWVDIATQADIVEIWPEFSSYMVTIGGQPGFMIPAKEGPTFIRTLAKKVMA